MKPMGPFLEVVSGAAEADDEVEQVLGAARAWAEPSAENRERVSSALRGALPPVSSAGGLAGTALRPSAAAPKGAAKVVRTPSVHAGRTSWWLVGGALIGVLGFWLGHGVGYGSGQRDAAEARVAEALAARSSWSELSGAARSAAPPASAQGTPAADGPSANAPSASAPATRPPLVGAPPGATAALPPASGLLRAPSSGRAETDASARPQRPATRASARSVPRSARSAGAPRARGDDERAQRAPAGMSFRQVLDQLRRAQQQLRNGQATMSLLVLSELDRAAGDVLLEERDATRVLALCAAGQDDAARAVARRLEHDSPRSIYGMRLEASCITDAPGQPGSVSDTPSSDTPSSDTPSSDTPSSVTPDSITPDSAQ